MHPHGPYALDGALETVHDRRFLESQVCGKCHEEQYSEWEDAVALGATESCQECHMPRRVRRLTQNWTALFHSSKRSRDHSWSLEPLWDRTATITARVTNGGGKLQVLVRNVGALHGLPTGTCGKKGMTLEAEWGRSDTGGKRWLARWSGAAGEAISPGEARLFSLPVDAEVRLKRVRCRLRYERGAGKTARSWVLAEKTFVVQGGRVIWVEDSKGRASLEDPDRKLRFLPAPGKTRVTLGTRSSSGSMSRSAGSVTPDRLPPLLPPRNRKDPLRPGGVGGADPIGDVLEGKFAGSDSASMRGALPSSLLERVRSVRERRRARD